MTLSTREIAEAFSGHNFAAAFPHLDEHVIWRLPGSDAIHGRDAVIAVTQATTAQLIDTQIHTERCVVVDGGDTVAVDTVTRYDDHGDISTVASADIYEFHDGMISQITSYTVETLRVRTSV